MGVLALTFRTVYSAGLQENAGLLVVVELKYVLRDVSNITLIWHFSMLGMHVRLIYLRNTFS